MAHGHHENLLAWDWDSVLLLSNPSPRTSPVIETNGSNSNSRPLGVAAGGGASPVLSPDHRHHQHRDSVQSNEASNGHWHTDSRSSETLDKSSSRSKSRDSRLDCPNFLAGKVPCACTENDDDDSGVSRKRSKPVPRCQVAACGADLTDLKGYHQRHRVCLRCAHAIRVILRGQPHRYCQQCGKFHAICDFDEGKRSCRRKLEKHNNRRRRKAGEDGLSGLDYGDADAPNDTSPGEGMKLDDGEQKDFNQKKPSFDTEETTILEAATSSFASGEKSRAVVKASESLDLPEDEPLDVPPPPETSEPTPTETGQAESRYEDARSTTHPDSDFPLHNGPALVEAPEAQARSGNVEESLLALLMEGNGEVGRAHFPDGAAAGEQPLVSGPLLWESPSSPRRLSKDVAAYSSPLPTGRISFKLYDWNPGDFPRHLRQQVMEWLSNMPVDLEGYIRSGCTILTIFISMLQPGWDKLNADWAGAVLKLVKAEQRLFRFWSSGYLIARLNDAEVHINNGELAQPRFQRVCEPAVLDKVRPLCLEVGRPEEVTILGRNFEKPHSRLLVSFDGEYVINDAYQSRMQGKRKGAVNRVHSSEKSDNSTLCVTMPPFSSKKSGVAYIEVEHISGTSNYIPLLVAEKGIVEEIRSLEEELDNRPSKSCCASKKDCLLSSQMSRQGMHSLLFDLGWVLKSASHAAFASDVHEEISELHAKRLQKLLLFAIKRSWRNVAQKVLQLACRAGSLPKVGVLENRLSALQVAVLNNKATTVEHLINCGESFHGQESLCQKPWWNLSFTGPTGLTVLHSMALQSGAGKLHDTSCTKKGLALMWTNIRDNSGQTPKDYCPLYGITVANLLPGTTEYTTKAQNLNESTTNQMLEAPYEDINSSRLEESTTYLHANLPYSDSLGAVARGPVMVSTHWRLLFPWANFIREKLSLYTGRGDRDSNRDTSKIKRCRVLRSLSICSLLCAGVVCVMLQPPQQVILAPVSSRWSLYGSTGSQ